MSISSTLISVLLTGALAFGSTAAAEDAPARQAALSVTSEQTTIDDLSLKILLKVVELNKFMIKFMMAANPQGRWKGWRYFAFQETDAALIESGQITAIVQREHQIHDHGRVNAVGLEDSQLPSMIGQFIGPIGDLTELAVNGYHGLRAKRQGYDARHAKKRAMALRAEINEMIAARAEMIRQATNLNRSDLDLYAIEGKLLQDLERLSWIEYSNFHAAARRMIVSQNTFYALDIAKNLTGALGNMVNVIGLHQNRPYLNLPSNVLVTVSGGLLVLNPLLSKVAGQFASRYHSDGLDIELKHGGDDALKQFQTDLDEFKRFASASSEAKSVMLPGLIDRVTLYQTHSKWFSDRVRKEERENQKAFTAALGRVGIASLVGSTKMSQGITGIVAAQNLRYHPSAGASVIVSGNIAYAAGTAVTLVDNLKLEIMREIRLQRNRRNGEMPRQILERELIRLEETEKSLQAMQKHQ